MASPYNFRRFWADFLLDAFDGVLGSEPETADGRRRAFVSANLFAGGMGVALWPLHFAFIGPVDAATAAAFLFLWAPLGIALLVKSETLSLEQGQMASALSLGGFVSLAAIYTGGLASPLLPWLLIVPVEAAIAGKRSAVTIASCVAGLGFFAAAMLSLMGWLPVSRIPAEFAPFAYGVSVFASIIVGMFAMRTLQRRNEDEIARVRANAAWHRALTDNAADLITRHGANGTVLYASPAVEEMLGLRARELEGMSPAMFVHIQDLRNVEQAFAAAARGEVQRVAYRLRRRDGTHLPVEMRVQGAGGEAIAVTRDMSNAKAEIVELAQALDKAEEVSRAKSRFLASVTHELRTPLNAIIGFSDVMRHELMGPIGTPKYREYAELIRNSGSHLVDLISDLLDMSKIEAGKFTIEAKLVELKPVADECLAMVKVAADEAGVELVCDVAPGLSLMADRRALKQCLINLLSNAIKFTLSEGKVTLKARRVGSDIMLSVSDTGVGIPEKDLARIGKPFEQVEGEMQRTHKGTGLGLSLVKALAELHGGAMMIESALGDGTTVTLKLPLAARNDVPGEPGEVVFPEKFRVRA
jgi:two-component system, cell cycle sensor histidine kinase DivJ